MSARLGENLADAPGQVPSNLVVVLWRPIMPTNYLSLRFLVFADPYRAMLLGAFRNHDDAMTFWQQRCPCYGIIVDSWQETEQDTERLRAQTILASLHLR